MTNARQSPNGTHSETWKENSGKTADIKTYSISSINRLPEWEKRSIYCKLIPPGLLEKISETGTLQDPASSDLLRLYCPPDSPSVEIALYHQVHFPDPVLYGHLSDTLNGQIHVLLYILNDPNSPRFDIDRLPDGTPTRFGTSMRNLSAEIAALEFGLAPGQVRKGFRLLGEAIRTFEHFVTELGQSLFFVEPLFYHNAVIFERYGFNYQSGRKLMDRIQRGFLPGGDLCAALDGSNPFRRAEAAESIRLRSWAIHDKVMGEPFDGVTMYKWIGQSAEINTCPLASW